MALFHTTVVDNQIKALDTIGTASGSIATFDTDRAENLINLEVAITATGGGGTPVSPIAINGFSACDLVACGKNLFDNSLMVNSQTTVVGDTVTLTATGNFQGSAFAFMPVKQGCKYALNIDSLTSGSGVEIRRYNSMGTVTNTIPITQNTIININDETTVKISIVYSNKTMGAGTFVLKGFNIALGEEYQSYHAYNGTTETIPFGQTIYGGSLNVGSGVLTVNKAFVEFDGTENWGYAASGANQLYYLTGADFSYSIVPDSNDICSCFPRENIYTSTTDEGFIIYLSGGASRINVRPNLSTYPTVADFKQLLVDLKTANTPMQVCFKITPTTIQLDSKQIQAIIGTNNIYADTGDIIDLKFILSVGKAIS